MSTPTVGSPRLEYGTDTSPVPAPRVSWITTAAPDGWLQSGAELRLATTDGEQTATVDGGASVLVEWPFTPLTARQRGDLSVRVRGEGGDWSEWSEPVSFSATFLDDGEWTAQFVGLADPAERATPYLLRHEFEVRPGLERATWYATALGVYEAGINGTTVDDQFLKPGWTPYQYRLVHETTDVTGLVNEGSNAIGVSVTGGWYTENFGFRDGARPVYGPQPSFAGQLLLEYADGSSEWIVTGSDWRISDRSPVIRAGIYLGEDYDARRIQDGWDRPGFDASGWADAAVMDAGPVPGPRTGPVVRVTETLSPVEVITTPSGKTILDFGQNLVGRLRIRVSGPAGHEVTLRHAEVLEDGELGIRPLRAARAMDVFTLAGAGVEEYAPTFTFHGFRYAQIDGWPGALDPAAIVAEVIGSDLRRTGWFESSDPMVNRLHENVVWGMRGNFLYLPTDCPQRDERLGWTGDIQVFAPTASFLFDTNGFLASWLQDLALEQEAAGGVPFIVPDVLDSAHTPAAAWGDAATLVPETLYQRFADRGLVATQYPSMKAWVDQLLELAGERHLWEGMFQFGDWVDPDAPPEDPAKAKTDKDLVASAYLFRSSVALADAARLLGYEEDAEFYTDRAEEVRAAWLREYATPAGRLVSDAQTAYALAICFGIVSGDMAQTMGDRLAWLTRRDGYRIGTGFVGTPLVNDALSSTGHVLAATRMLLQTECPSWLYSVSMGATTIWERWDSLLPDGSINPGEMTSFNHYALGAVADWLHRVVAGMAPDEPGYRRIRIAPTPLPGLTHASAAFDSAYGRITSGWERTDEGIVVTATVPPNATAVVVLPDGARHEVGSGQHRWVVASQPEAPTTDLTPDTSLAAIQDDPGAYASLMSAMRDLDPEMAAEFSLRTAWLPTQTLGNSMGFLSPVFRDGVFKALEAAKSQR
ncbi:family 78 glycoside hydrolase catalytic domain [Tessaracoccus defluvii]|uniref:alpha-L-rhamnosidase n=1 Tax=Tessaracoccus defluvii TaxID=1285901 RepID=A0A7H0H9H0_9ACTN|nr:family 78 glycoside hydrolase catalytic domain [Tessaracoccus defluvii]QNP57186.1 family 78 glycoside hydrolase catalytic domain [Tessaracoccus defluvii]